MYKICWRYYPLLPRYTIFIIRIALWAFSVVIFIFSSFFVRFLNTENISNLLLLVAFVAFIVLWCSGGAVYFLYIVSKFIDVSLNHAPTNCTITQVRYSDDDGWEIYANYTLPGSQVNYNNYLQNPDDNANYNINQILPCFYAIHDHTYITARAGSIGVGTGFEMFFAIAMCIPVAIGVLFVLFLTLKGIKNCSSRAWAALTKSAGDAKTKLISVFKRNRITNQNEFVTTTPKRSIGSFIYGYIMVPITCCKSAFQAAASWMKALSTWNTSKKDQSHDAYALEDQGSFTTRASSGFSFRSTKKLLSYTKSQHSNISNGTSIDEASVETRSL